MEKLTIVVDFDKTICEFKGKEFPNIGKPIRLALFTLKELKNNGHKMILLTRRIGTSLDIAKKYLESNDFKFDEYNPIEKGSPKIDYDLYIDDKTLGAPLDDNGFYDWTKGRALLRKLGVL